MGCQQRALDLILRMTFLMAEFPRRSYRPMERSTAVEPISAGSAGLKRPVITRSQPHSNEFSGADLLQSQMSTVSPTVRNMGLLQWRSMAFGMEAEWYVACGSAPRQVSSALSDQSLDALSSPQDRALAPSGLTATPRTKPSCARATTEPQERRWRFQARSSPSQLPLMSGAPGRRATARHLTESRCPSRARTKGFAKIFSIFTATRALWYSRERSKGWSAGSGLRKHGMMPPAVPT
mmetsp:Transcript_92094/g.269470  ORF Transcript_92094/g.269470 Transcript_92094/m.269470 type:complete len:237 (-) Transcript_92094:117-827(-)